MPKIEFKTEEIEAYFSGKTKRLFHDECIEIAESMKVHADGEFPEKLLRERRPNEPLLVNEYREKIWSPITKPVIVKVLSSLQKIRRSADWSIIYDGLDEFTKIADDETLEEYCENNFPYFRSVTNWVFAALLRKQIIDPNSIVVVIPLETEIPENEYLKPFPVVMGSEDVIDFMIEDYAVLRNPLGSKYTSRSGEEREGKSIYVVTTIEILRYDEINEQGDFKLMLQFPHNLGMLPCFEVKGVLIDQKGVEFLYESRIAGALPELNEAVREYSDLQAAKVLHIYPERWEYTNTECTTCKGTGVRRNPLWTHEGCGHTVDINCDECHGGYVYSSGVYSKILVKPQSILDGNPVGIPTPPAGFVEKDVEIIKVMEESVSAHKYNALAAINFQFLEKTPMSESGISKEVDRDELNNTVNSIAEDIVYCMDMIYKIIARYRYVSQYSVEEIEEMLPLIAVPSKYDILSPNHTGEELRAAKEGKANPIIVNALEIDYASKRFNTTEEVRERIQLILELDPLPNITEEDKMTRLSNKGISQETYIISSNITEFVQRAIEEDASFADKKLSQQKEVMKKFAQEQLAEAKEKEKAEMVNLSMNGLNNGEEDEEEEETDEQTENENEDA